MRRRFWAPWLFLSPLLMVLFVFLIGLVIGILQGFGYAPAFGLEQFTVSYFQKVLSQDTLMASVGISLYISFSAAGISVILAVLLCFALISLKQERGLLAAILRIPMFIPWVVTGLMMTQLLSGSGWLARFTAAIGLEGIAALFARVLYQPNHFGIILAFIWACTPFACFMLQTVMAQINDTLGEAAANLGAGRWRVLWNVTLPLCVPVVRNTFLILLLSCFGNYEIPKILGMTMPRALPLEIYYQYNHFDLQHRPYAMALNAIMLAIAMLLTTGVLWLGHRWRKKKGQAK